MIAGDLNTKKLGYSDNSPFRNEREIIFPNVNNITMKKTGIPLKIDFYKKGKLIQSTLGKPYQKEGIINPNADMVIERPVLKAKNGLSAGGIDAISQGGNLLNNLLSPDLQMLEGDSEVERIKKQRINSQNQINKTTTSALLSPKTISATGGVSAIVAAAGIAGNKLKQTTLDKHGRSKEGFNDNWKRGLASSLNPVGDISDSFKYGTTADKLFSTVLMPLNPIRQLVGGGKKMRSKMNDEINRELKLDQQNKLNNYNAQSGSVYGNMLKQSTMFQKGGKFRKCTEPGCAAFVTTRGSELLSLPREKYSIESGSAGSDAWTRKPYLIDKGGQEVDFSNFNNLKIGDVIGLDREENKLYDPNFKKSRDSQKYPRTTKNVHVGVITDFDEKGVPIIEHYADGYVYKEPLTDIKSYKKYNTVWAVRPNLFKDVELKSNKKDFNEDLKLSINSEIPARQTFVKTINDNLKKYQELSGLSQEELLMLGKHSLGILQRESKSGKTLEPLKLKEIVADIAYKFGKKNEPASEGLTRVKPSIFKNKDETDTLAGKFRSYLEIDDISGNTEDSANATMLNLIQNYKKLKNKYPEFTKEQLLTASLKSHQGFNKKDYNNILNYQDAYSNLAINESQDVSYPNDDKITLDRIRTLRLAKKLNVPYETILPEVDVFSKTKRLPWRKPKFQKGGVLKFELGGKMGCGCSVNQDGIDTDKLKQLSQNSLDKLNQIVGLPKGKKYDDVSKNKIKQTARESGLKLVDFLYSIPEVKNELSKINK